MRDLYKMDRGKETVLAVWWKKMGGSWSGPAAELGLSLVRTL